MSLEPLPGTLQNLLDQKTLKWVFVGGKGGVGKTTTSCSLAIQMSKVRSSILLISTDPAHNLSDAFGTKFGKDAKKVPGFENLSAMEIDPNQSIQEMTEQADQQNPNNPMSGMMQDLAFTIPGIDEALAFAEILKQVKSMEFDCVIFDTAPTGHTLRFLNFPTVLEKALGKLGGLSSRFGPMINQMSGLMGVNANQDDIFGKLEGMRENISQVNQQFKNAELTTFVCVCISEFLSLYETERMIQELVGYEIDVNNIVVNQLLLDPHTTCPQCLARRKMQQKYLDQIEELYEDFHIVKVPQIPAEVRGPEALKSFSEMLVKPYAHPSEK